MAKSSFALAQDPSVLILSDGLGFAITNELVVPYIMAFATREQKERWLPKMATSECITALAMTEPNAGSDLQSAQTTAVRDGMATIILSMVRKQKTFITNRILSDLVIVYLDTRINPIYGGTNEIMKEIIARSLGF